ncbi:MAG: hypothetical protein JWM27_3267 [Gemmatimonadetes bacterium]|nr:hypothetical protein [Gemmatimonadota bacterium]
MTSNLPAPPNDSEDAPLAATRRMAVARFERLREAVAPFAEARGHLTDEDVFLGVS